MRYAKQCLEDQAAWQVGCKIPSRVIRTLIGVITLMTRRMIYFASPLK